MANTTDEARVLEELIIANGINGTTGEYLLPEMTGSALLKAIEGLPRLDKEDPDTYYKLKDKDSQGKEAPLGVKYGVDPKKLEESGWGVIYAENTPDTVKEALSPLINVRRGQATKQNERLFQEYTYFGQSGKDFLFEHNVSPASPANPKDMPYYLLLVGSPNEIPYQFQYELDVDRAVGRIWFDTIDEYDNYAQSVVAAEEGKVRLPRRASFFGVANPDDRATQLSSNLLIEPLFQKYQDELAEMNRSLPWVVDGYLRDTANRDQLQNLLGGDVAKTPAFLFTASHGMGFNGDDSRLLAHQGALLCGDWDGTRGPISEDNYFAGEHIASDARLHGLISFFFACYGAGTPSHDEFLQRVEGHPRQIAPHALLAGLPRRMLSHPRGGALAVIGHVERAWTHSFKWGGGEDGHLSVFEETLDKLFDGFPIGDAFDVFNFRHAGASVQLVSLLENKRRGAIVGDIQLIQAWTVNNDARDYIILGDPAVRLCVSETEEEEVKPSTIQLKDVDLTPYRPGAVVPGLSSGDVTEASGGGDLAMPPQDAGTEDGEAMAIIPADLKGQIKTSLQNVTRQIAAALQDLSSLEVLTYLSDDGLENVYQNGKFSDKAKLKAVTLIALDGDVKSMIPARKVETLSEEKNKLTMTVEFDEELLKIHKDMVQLAQVNRTTFLKNLAEIAVTLVNTRL